MNHLMKSVCATILLFTLISVRAYGQEMASSAEQARQFYKGKTITVKVAASPGGTFDLIPRLISSRLRKVTGTKAVIIQSDLRRFIASANVFARSRKLGLHLMHINGPVVLWNQITKAPGVNYDLAKFRWLSSASPIGNILFMRGSLPYKNYNDLKKAAVIRLGGGGRFSTTPVTYALACKNFGLKCRFVLGYRGAAPGLLALKTGEVDLYGATATLTAVREREALKKGDLRIFAITAAKRAPLFPDIPTWWDLGGNKWQEPYKSWAKRMESLQSGGFCWVMPPGTPDHLVQFMRQVIEETYADPKIQELFQKRIGSKDAVIENFTGGIATEKRIKGLLNQRIGEKDLKWLAGLVNSYVP